MCRAARGVDLSVGQPTLAGRKPFARLARLKRFARPKKMPAEAGIQMKRRVEDAFFFLLAGVIQ
jgi:hypothetical protein